MKTFRDILEDVRGKVQVGNVTIDTDVTFQRILLNVSELDKLNGYKNPLTIPEIEKIAKESKKYWKAGGEYVKYDGDKVFIELSWNHDEHPKNRGYYAGWNHNGWVGSGKIYKKPKDAISDAHAGLVRRMELLKRQQDI